MSSSDSGSRYSAVEPRPVPQFGRRSARSGRDIVTTNRGWFRDQSNR
jgi:hypothetical protein